jgi:hypothetical protein
LLGHYILLSGVVTATNSQLICDDNVSPKYIELIVKIHYKAQEKNYVLKMNRANFKRITNLICRFINKTFKNSQKNNFEI